MKKMFVALLGLMLSAGFVQAQEDGAKLAKSAGKALTSYNIDPANNQTKLDEAKQKIEEALKYGDAQALPSTWITKGDIYNTILQRDMAKRMVNSNAPLSGDNDALVAFDAYKKGYEIATKKFEKSDAIKGIGEVQGHMINIGAAKYDAGEYEKAFFSFRGALQSHEMLSANGQKSLLDDLAQYDNQMYVTGLAAMLAKRNADAMPYFENLYRKGTDKPAVYEGLYNCKIELGDADGAAKVLTEGRQKFPDDPGLLFAEINQYLKAGKLDELTTRLKQAIAQEPSNVGLYITLGNVYDNLYQREQTAKNEAKATEYFNEAKTYYTQATEKDPKNVDANYALGALYYNKAAYQTQELNAMPEDFSTAGMKKYNAKKDEVMALFDLALPYFQKAENLDPNDMNTLIALTEIYARKEDELSLEFKKRLGVVKDGGKNSSPYFKK